MVIEHVERRVRSCGTVIRRKIFQARHRRSRRPRTAPWGCSAWPARYSTVLNPKLIQANTITIANSAVGVAAQPGLPLGGRLDERHDVAAALMR